jgi:hypothetical protein
MNPNPPTITGAPPPGQDQVDLEHLKLLSIFHYVVAGLAALIACIPFIHLAMGLFFLFGRDHFGPPGNQPPPFVGLFFVGIASFFILAGWAFAVLVFLNGRFISGRKHYRFCFVMACIECVFMPFGTVLGAFTILVLVRESVKELFAPGPS